MPYPILTLPYPFAKRLRQLLHPFELEELQRAAGPYVRNELKPFVKSCKIEIALISPESSTEYDIRSLKNQFSFPIVNKSLINSSISVCCSHLSNRNFEKPTTKSALVKSNKVVFTDCHITNELLKNVAKLVYNPCKLFLCNSSWGGIDKDVTLPTIFDLFPNTSTILFEKAYSGWLDDLKATKKEFQAIGIMHDRFDELFSFKASDLYDFIKNQCPKFSVTLTYRVDASRYDWIIHMMNKFIDCRFSNAKNGFCKVILRVQLLSSDEIYKEYFFYYKKCVLQ